MVDTIKWKHGILGTYRYLEGAYLSGPMSHKEVYLLGFARPHFPVPAIQVKCFFHPEYINVVRYNGNQGIYGPGYETIHEWPTRYLCISTKELHCQTLGYAQCEYCAWRERGNK